MTPSTKARRLLESHSRLAMRLRCDLKARVRATQVRAVLSVNWEMVLLYWSIDREILRCRRGEGWGAKVVERLAKDLRMLVHRSLTQMSNSLLDICRSTCCRWN
jgi:hypothetical protein